MMRRLKVKAIKVISTTGQYLCIAPLIPVYIVHLLGEWLLEFAEWCVYGNTLRETMRPWVIWLFKTEAALDAWRSKSLASLTPYSTSQTGE